MHPNATSRLRDNGTVSDGIIDANDGVVSHGYEEARRELRAGESPEKKQRWRGMRKVLHSH